MKKLITLLLCVTMLASVLFAIPVSAAKTVKGELLFDGDMERLDSVTRWDSRIHTVSTDIVHSGEKSMKVTTTDPESRNAIRQNVDFGLIGGEEYEVSMWVYVEEQLEGSPDWMQTGPWIKLGFGDQRGVSLGEFEPGAYGFDVPLKKWTKVSAKYTVPEDALTGAFFLRFDGAGTCYFDDVSFYGAMTERYVNIHKEMEEGFKEAVEIQQRYIDLDAEKNANPYIDYSYENPVKNNSFEEFDEEGIPTDGWICRADTWNQYHFISDEEAHSGNYSMKLHTEEDVYWGSTCWVAQKIVLTDKEFAPGQKHVISAWVKTKTKKGNGAYMKLESGAGGQFSSNVQRFEDDEWHQINFVVDVEEAAKEVTLLYRMQGIGTVYIDDVSFRPGTYNESMVKIKSDYFHYTENEYASAIAEINNKRDAIPVGAVVEWQVKDGDTVLLSETVPAKKNTTWKYPVMIMEEMKRPYILKAIYKNADGSVISESEPWEIYRYNRPTHLAADGTYLKDGEPFYPNIGYEIVADCLNWASEGGINVIREANDTTARTNLTVMKEYLDEAYEKGYMVPIALYFHYPAGHPGSIQRIKDYVETFKDHPAVFAWMIMDEPSGRPGYDETLYWLKQAYIQIRAIDDNHPVYVLDTVGQVEAPFYRTAKNGDVMLVDPYPMSDDLIVSEVGNRTQRVINSVPSTKPVYSITDTYKQWGEDPGIPVHVDYMRHKYYQMAWAGVKGYGMYGLVYPTLNLNVHDHPEVWEGYQQWINSGEYAEMVDHFSAKNSPIFVNHEEDNFRYRAWVKEGSVYVVVQEMKNRGCTATIDLTSTNNKVKVEGFSGVVINGSDEKTISSDNNVFTVELTPKQSIMYKLTPNNTINVEDLNLPKYDDLADVAWAADAIEQLGAIGYVNDITENTYAPQVNITRGEFAYFLMNTLGITKIADAEQFSDVDSNAYYANHILAGRRAGILNGSGNNMYNPESPITRQDAMAIIARGMKYVEFVGATDTENRLKPFYDNWAIADYAREPIAVMTEEGIVKGNPDGSINPLGNITRAEAAVIMARILNTHEYWTEN